MFLHDIAWLILNLVYMALTNLGPLNTTRTEQLIHDQKPIEYTNHGSISAYNTYFANPWQEQEQELTQVVNFVPENQNVI